jgi:hypothetical protein
MTDWNWMPCLAPELTLRIILIPLIFYLSNKILPHFPRCSNPCWALVAVPATLLLPFATATCFAAGLFHLGLRPPPGLCPALLWPLLGLCPNLLWPLLGRCPTPLLTKIQLYPYRAPLIRKLFGASLPGSSLLRKRPLDPHRAPPLRKLLFASLLLTLCRRHSSRLAGLQLVLGH